MKNLLLTCGAVVAACALAFGVCYTMSDEPELRRAARENDAMAWLQTEFHLSEGQFAAIKQLHDDYGVVCGAHCAAIMAAKARPAPAAEIAALEKTCVDAMADELNEVIKRMSARLRISGGKRPDLPAM